MALKKNDPKSTFETMFAKHKINLNCKSSVQTNFNRKNSSSILNMENASPLLIATKKDRLDLVLLFIKYGAHIDSFNSQHQTALHVAVQN